MSNFELADPRHYDYDLQSIYSAYIGHFQANGIPWYERSWGTHFASFAVFLSFSWPAMCVTDAWSGRAHVCVRSGAIDAFLKMIKQRHKEPLQIPPNIVRISPWEISQKPVRQVSDLLTYKKLHATIPAVALSAFKARVRSGEPKAIRELWAKRDKTFLAIDFEWSERNSNSCLEWGYAAVRCGHIESAGQWPPVPDQNYRKGHYIVSEYVDKVHNKHTPTHPWQYAFGDSLLISKSKLPQIIEALISSLSSPDSETVANNVVLVAHGIHNDLKRLEEMKIKIPHNMLIVDTASLEKALFTIGERPPMLDPTKPGQARQPGSVLSLENLLVSFTLPSSDTTFTHLHRPIVLPDCLLHNAGNDAFLGLFAFQMLMEPEHTAVPTTKSSRRPNSRSAVPFLGNFDALPPPVFPSMGGGGSPPHGSPKKNPNRNSMGPRRESSTPSPHQLTPPAYPPGHFRSRTSSGTGLHAQALNAKSLLPNNGTTSFRTRTVSAGNDLAEEFGAMAKERQRASMLSLNGNSSVGGGLNLSRSKSPRERLAAPEQQADGKKEKKRSSMMDFAASLRGLGGK
ncbi:hypothetical protein DL96DRAFT_1489226 [Flagelloscypha sp. PMI_526]|nr:hypothetical protein DL96DRAFT_1489226 [Flagelloscypha sp. PMI_526]